MNILFSYRSEAEKQFAKDVLTGHTITFIEGSLNDSEWEGDDVECISIFVNSQITSDILDRLPKLKLITTRSTGYDHIDIKTAKERGIAVSTVPGYGEHSVAEFTFAILLALVRKVCEGAKRVGEGGFYPDGLTGFDLYGKTLGVVGTGAIGKSVMRIAKGFGMSVLAFDIMPDQEYASTLGARCTSLDEVVQNADILTLHAPENEHTKHMINASKFALMKKGVVIVNTARGGLIDTAALVDALKDNIVSGVALDVLEEETNMNDELQFLTAGHSDEKALKTAMQNHFLIEDKRVLVTPHIAFNTKEAEEIILKTTVDSIESFVHGEPKHTV